MIDTRTEYKEKLLNTIQIQNRIVENSKHFDNKTKEAFINFSTYWADRIQKKSLTLTQLKSIANDILTFWKESIGVDVEIFWVELQKNNIDFIRKDELNFALEKGRFRRVDMGMAARKDWAEIREFKSIRDRFSKSEIEMIDSIIEQDEKKRCDILKKCLLKRKVPQSQYLKYGECIAYFIHCRLFGKYFTEEEVRELNNIWE